jgi:formate hydrogenlyase subunit 4
MCQCICAAISNGHLRALLADEGAFKQMLWTIFVIALILWLLGLVTSYTLGGLIHILLVVAVIALVVQLISGRRSIL